MTGLGQALVELNKRSGIRFASCAAAQKQQKEVTHTLMCGRGGVLCIAPELEDAFFEALGADILAGHFIPLVERRTEIFKFCCDLDLPAEHKILEPSELDLIGNCASGTVQEFWRPSPNCPDPSVCVVLVPKKRPLDLQASAGGIHLIFPHCPVNAEQALTLSAALRHRFETLGLDVDFQKAMDPCIYQANHGLRMLGSTKCKTCSECGGRGSRAQTCAACFGSGSGLVLEGRQYWCWNVFPEDACLRQRLQSNPAWAVRFCSIRITGSVPQPQWVCPEWAPALEMAKRGRKRGEASANLEENLLPELGEDLRTLLGEALRNVSSYYSDLRITRLHGQSERKGRASDQNRTYFLVVKGPYDRFCLNKDGVHSSNHIYFCIRPQGLFQRCHSAKVPANSTYNCADWHAGPFPVPPALRSVLWPELVPLPALPAASPTAAAAVPLLETGEPENMFVVPNLSFCELQKLLPCARPGKAQPIRTFSSISPGLLKKFDAIQTLMEL